MTSWQRWYRHKDNDTNKICQWNKLTKIFFMILWNFSKDQSNQSHEQM